MKSWMKVLLLILAGVLALGVGAFGSWYFLEKQNEQEMEEIERQAREAIKEEQTVEKEKIRIARYAAALIQDTDFVYLDAGTTTGYMLEFLTGKKASFVTNAVAHAQRLAAQGNQVFLVGGELKSSTEAVIGSQAIETLLNYHFTKGFFGTNGITRKTGFTTPDVGEAQVKRTAMKQCLTGYVLADATKFGNISAVTFAPFGSGIILTDRRVEGYEEDILVCEE